MKTIIVVEPEKALCELMLSILADVVDLKKYNIAGVSSLEDTLPSLARSYDPPCALVFVPFEANTGRGLRIAQYVKQENPMVKVVLTSAIENLLPNAGEVGLDAVYAKQDFFPPTKLHHFLVELGIEL